MKNGGERRSMLHTVLGLGYPTPSGAPRFREQLRSEVDATRRRQFQILLLKR